MPAASVVRLPEGVSAQQGAAVLLQGLTAKSMIEVTTDVKKGARGPRRGVALRGACMGDTLLVVQGFERMVGLGAGGGLVFIYGGAPEGWEGRSQGVYRNCGMASQVAGQLNPVAGCLIT